MAASKDDARAELDRLASAGIVSNPKTAIRTSWPTPSTVDWSVLSGHSGQWLKALNALVEREYAGSLEDYPAIVACIGEELGGVFKNALYLEHCHASALEKEVRSAANTQDPLPVE